MLTEFDCDLDPSPVVCGNINAYPTFCCPEDDNCRAHIDNVQVGYDHDAAATKALRDAVKDIAWLRDTILVLRRRAP